MIAFPALAFVWLLLARPSSAATWYFLRYNAPANVKFTGLSGDMVVPPLPHAGVYYLWPGLQPRDGSGVYQNVLDGRKSQWWIGSGWCCSNPNLPWGDGFNVNKGDVVTFSNVLLSDNSAWKSTLTRHSSGQTASNTFAPLASKSFNQVLLAIELTNEKWDFGQLSFTNITITSSGSSDTSWCTKPPENYKSASKYAIAGVKATASGNTVTCTISSVTLQAPA